MESEQPPFECPHLVHENKRRSHVPLKSHLTLDSAVRGFLPTAQQELPGDESNKRIQSLAGNDWQFCLYPSPDWVPEGWETNPKYDHYDAEEGWGAISVPGNWELQGHGVPIYANFTYPIPLDPPRVPANANPTGCYVKHFNYTAPPVPGKMGKRVFLQFEGVDSFFQCWLNGSYVGMSKDSRLTAEFDVSHLIKGGKNFLAVQVLRWSDATYLEDQDMWRTSGIHRDVLICTKPALHVSDIAVTTPLGFGSVNGAAEGGPPLTMARLESLIYLEGPSDEALSQATVTAHLVRQADGQAVMDPIKLPVTAGKWYARDMADMAAAEASHGKKFPGGHGGGYGFAFLQSCRHADSGHVMKKLLRQLLLLMTPKLDNSLPKWACFEHAPCTRVPQP
ncbi:galactose-binding domain-like protein [Dunaliella salina]|uniref:beta-galactosidase n=1 Tax=Dunaliella salina TaxID=3046 RepID=A0ABQ7GB09_DUNSA|nr:galactose-binding domain-like protein [Dunaliella salina]|eukprot:KAF5831795.1 galactose-binding domain-like protein [Dunaliella salina]